MKATIRLATEEDAADILEIYTPIIRDTAISFETKIPTGDEMRERIRQKITRFPWLVCEVEKALYGFLYASEFDADPHDAAVYRWSVISSIYVSERARKKGVASALYHAMFGILKLQGYYNVFAGITLPNVASVGLHEALGFQPVGVYRAVGYRLGAWRDVGWWQYVLQEHGPEPVEPLSLTAAVDSPAWREILAAAQASIKV